jgi:hypothetical protein
MPPKKKRNNNSNQNQKTSNTRNFSVNTEPQQHDVAVNTEEQESFIRQNAGKIACVLAATLGTASYNRDNPIVQNLGTDAYRFANTLGTLADTTVRYPIGWMKECEQNTLCTDVFKIAVCSYVGHGNLQAAPVLCTGGLTIMRAVTGPGVPNSDTLPHSPILANVALTPVPTSATPSVDIGPMGPPSATNTVEIGPMGPPNPPV